jgi:putative hydrolase of the HAD superfamily
MLTISCLLFDLGGVLIRNAGFERLNALLPAPLEAEALKARLLASPSFRAFELGESAPEPFAEALVSELCLSCSPEAFLAEFETWPQGFYPGATELLAQLRARYRLACLSNSNAIHWGRFSGFREHFDVALSSHLLGAIKPDAACFHKALGECGVTADEVLFFDDALVNVEAARACGIESLHVLGFSQVCSRVQELGLLARR